MLLLKLIIFILALYSIGRALALTFRIDDYFKGQAIAQMLSNLVLGLASVILLAHLASFIFQDFTFCSKLVFYIATISSLILLFKTRDININQCQLSKLDWTVVLTSVIFAALMGLRRLFHSQPDNFHMAVVSGIFHNSAYPPLLSSNPEINLSSYHYGTDLITVLIQSVLGLDSFLALAIQIGLSTLLAFCALFALFNYVSKNQIYALLYTLFVGLYTSSNSIEYFFKKLFQQELFSTNFLRDWFFNSCTSVTHLTSQLRLPSQSIAWSLSLLLILYLIIFLKEQKKGIPAIVLISFLLYFIFPAYYYPILAASLVSCAYIFLLRQDKLATALSSAAIIASVVIGKLLTFTSKHGESNGVNGLIFRFNDNWTMWTQEYLFNFYTRAYLQSLPNSFDFTDNKLRLAAPFFSIVSLREFLIYFLIALVLLVMLILKKKKLSSEIGFSFITATISMTVPFCVSFLPREIETHRFLLFAKILFIICSVFILMKLFETKKINIIAVAFLSIFCVPGLVSLMPVKKYIQNAGAQVSKESQELIKVLAQFHKSGDICLDNINFIHGHTLCELAGFYGVGGRMYQFDELTRETAINSLDYGLLKDLNVDYILLNQKQLQSLSTQSHTKLNDSNYFETIALNIPNFYFYKFKKENVHELAPSSSIKWIQACRKGNQLIVINKSSKKLSMEEIKGLANKIQEKDKVCAYWLSQQAILDHKVL